MVKNKVVIIATTLVTVSAVFLIPENKEDTRRLLQRAQSTLTHVLPNKKGSRDQKRAEIIKTFHSQKMRVLNELPLKRDLQGLEQGDSHYTPELLKSFAKKMASIKENTVTYAHIPEIQVAALDFYALCSDREEYPLSIRSLCLFNRIKLAKAQGESVDISGYPLEMKKLVIQLRPF
ncbi:MAG: hypothetical protein VXV96_02375 [Bdellovibrionota bacterium]|nr:hypothetical protein [Bdellovibrionota bacterium]